VDAGDPPVAAAQRRVDVIRAAAVNCYLVAAGDGFVLIDTGKPENRGEIADRIAAAGCPPAVLKLIVLTHGDYDHAGNAVFLRAKHGARIAMHRNDAPRVEQGDWSLGMKPRPDKFPLLYRTVARFIKPGPFDTFTPDLCVEDGQELATFGLAATVLHLPGHTRGSIGVLTSTGELFCGDLMDSMMGRPSLEFFIDDMPAAQASLARLRDLQISTVYPGHGKPFRLEEVR